MYVTLSPFFKRVTLHRQNPDSGINNYGYRLTDFCRDNGIYTLNGRTNGNSNICNTCKNVSTVDYFLVSPEMFQYVDSLIVSDFCGLLSDAHNPVSLTLTISHAIQTARSDTYTERIRLWDSENSENFLAHLDENKLGSILNNIIHLENDRQFCRKILTILLNLYQLHLNLLLWIASVLLEKTLTQIVINHPTGLIENVKEREKNFIGRNFYISFDHQKQIN